MFILENNQARVRLFDASQEFVRTFEGSRQKFADRIAIEFSAVEARQMKKMPNRYRLFPAESDAPIGAVSFSKGEEVPELASKEGLTISQLVGVLVEDGHDNHAYWFHTLPEAQEFIKAMGTGACQCTIVRRKEQDQPRFDEEGNVKS